MAVTVGLAVAALGSAEATAQDAVAPAEGDKSEPAARVAAAAIAEASLVARSRAAKAGLVAQALHEPRGRAGPRPNPNACEGHRRPHQQRLAGRARDLELEAVAMVVAMVVVMSARDEQSSVVRPLPCCHALAHGREALWHTGKTP